MVKMRLFSVFRQYGFSKEQGYVNRGCLREVGHLLKAGDTRDTDPKTALSRGYEDSF